MDIQIEKELFEFKQLSGEISNTYPVKNYSEYAIVISPKQSKNSNQLSLPSNKSIGLTIAAIIHGNEVYGIKVCNRILALIAHQIVELPFPIGVILGNYRAAYQKKRFLEKDLNRCFAQKSHSLWEQKRALELENILADTAWFIDFHQTIQPSVRPFFIFPYSKSSLRFAADIHPLLPIVTHWQNASFSSEGLCSDEFVNQRGGIGLTVEAGQAGFDSYQIGLGVDLSLGALKTVFHYLKDPKQINKPTSNITNDLYTWADTVPYPKEGQVSLLAGWKNFSPLKKGEIIGSISDTPLLARESGWMLFPKYVDEKEKMATLPTELFRIVRRITTKDLPG